jgi:hypothetical protein
MPPSKRAQQLKGDRVEAEADHDANKATVHATENVRIISPLLVFSVLTGRSDSHPNVSLSSPISRYI